MVGNEEDGVFCLHEQRMTEWRSKESSTYSTQEGLNIVLLHLLQCAYTSPIKVYLVKPLTGTQAEEKNPLRFTPDTPYDLQLATLQFWPKKIQRQKLILTYYLGGLKKSPRL